MLPAEIAIFGPVDRRIKARLLTQNGSAREYFGLDCPETPDSEPVPRAGDPMSASRNITRFAVTAACIAAVAVGGTATAAADEWPPMPDYPTPFVPFETKNFLTPADPAYWNPIDARERLTSPFGTSTRIVCTAFHGVTYDCWQADERGNPHKLVRLPVNLPSVTGSSMPGGGPGHYVYPGFIPGI